MKRGIGIRQGPRDIWNINNEAEEMPMEGCYREADKESERGLGWCYKGVKME